MGLWELMTHICVIGWKGSKYHIYNCSSIIMLRHIYTLRTLLTHSDAIIFIEQRNKHNGLTFMDLDCIAAVSKLILCHTRVVANIAIFSIKDTEHRA